nr:LTP2 [Colobanthus quitensis]
MSNSQKLTIWTLTIFTIISLSLINNVTAQSPFPAPVGAPGPATLDCMTPLYNMTDCLSYVTKGSNSTKPDKPCCPELAGLLDSNPICLCELLGSSSKDLPIELDYNRALMLPKMCKLETPPLSLCAAAGVPVGLPAGAPMTSSLGPSSSVAGIPISSAGPVSGAGEPSPANTGASSVSFSLLSLVACLAVVLTSLIL